MSRVEELFEFHLDRGVHRGAQLVVYHEGKRVLDLAGGTKGGGEAVEPSTPFVLFCASKPYVAVAVHQLVEREVIDYEDPVRKYWPSFAEPGTRKAEISVGNVLSHSAGYPRALAKRVDVWLDRDRAVRMIEDLGDADLAFTPGETAQYHTVSWGWILDELVRRVTGTPLPERVRNSVFDPLGMQDTSLGLRNGMDPASIDGFPGFQRAGVTDPETPSYPFEHAAEYFNQEIVQRTPIPATGANGCARDLARFYACLACDGELEGERLLSPETLDRATRIQHDVDHDPALGVPERYARGFLLAGNTEDFFGQTTPDHVFGHDGFHSTVGWADREAGLAMAYTTNAVRSHWEAAGIFNPVCDAVHVLSRV